MFYFSGFKKSLTLKHVTTLQNEYSTYDFNALTCHAIFFNSVTTLQNKSITRQVITCQKRKNPEPRSEAVAIAIKEQ